MKFQTTFSGFTLVCLFFCLLSSSPLLASPADFLLGPPFIKEKMQQVAEWQMKEFEEGRNPYVKNEWENSSLYTGLFAYAAFNGNARCCKGLGGPDQRRSSGR